MSEPNTRKPLRIIHDDLPQNERPWRVRATDGHVRGPMDVAGLRSLVEMGIVTQDAALSTVSDSEWHPIATHPLWQQIRPLTKPFAFRNAELVEEVVTPPISPATVAIRPERAERMQAAQQAALNRTARGLMYWEIGRALRCLRELLVFFAFVTVGDLTASFFDHALGMAKAGVFMCLTAIALMYYCFRATVR